jgi:glycosyltransferase involved in cell wall biosynthesis
MTGRPTVSIAIATYNGARYLREQLDSLASQSLQPAEVLVGDDGSTDETLEIVRQFAATAPFPVLVTQNRDRLGYGENFLQIARRAGGRYVAFCDQDDIWLPNKLELCVSALESRKATLCAHDATIVGETLDKRGVLRRQAKPGVHGTLTLSPWGVFFGFTIVFRRDLLEIAPMEDRPDDNIRFDQKLAHDRWVYFLSTTFGSTVYLAEALALYRQHGQNLFGAKAGGSLHDFVERVRASGPHLEGHLAICGQRIAILDRVSAQRDDDIALQAARGAEYWRRLARIYRHRLAAASSPCLRHRLLALVKLAQLGAYSPFAKGGLTLRALAKDLIDALCAGHRCPMEGRKAEGLDSAGGLGVRPDWHVQP